MQTLNGHASYVLSSNNSSLIYALTLLPNGYLVSSSDDKTIKIWNPTTGELI